MFELQNADMRTTVELSDSTYRRLRAASARGNRGFSAIVEEAVSLYLDGAQERAEIARDIEAARGAWPDEDVEELEQALESAWSSGWQIDRP
jgi:predicted transcriptional regulator